VRCLRPLPADPLAGGGERRGVPPRLPGARAGPEDLHLGRRHQGVAPDRPGLSVRGAGPGLRPRQRRELDRRGGERSAQDPGGALHLGAAPLPAPRPLPARPATDPPEPEPGDLPGRRGPARSRGGGAAGRGGGRVPCGLGRERVRGLAPDPGGGPGGRGGLERGALRRALGAGRAGSGRGTRSSRGAARSLAAGPGAGRGAPPGPGLAPAGDRAGPDPRRAGGEAPGARGCRPPRP